MANYVGAIEQFNPYIQQIPTEAYTKVGMFKEQQYQAGLAKVQDTVDHIAGLDIANEGGREYLRNRVDELTKTLNKYNQVDFSNTDNVTQLVSLAKPLYQDENIVNDVINTGVYRKWAKEAGDAFRAGKMELGQYVRETTSANQWLNSDAAGAEYTGRMTPNTATKKNLVDKVIKAKKDGLEKNEYVYDANYSKDTPYYVKQTNKYYSAADFNNFVTDSIMDTSDREMLMNEHWYENQGVPTKDLQATDISMYQAKIDDNLERIKTISEYAKTLTGDAKTEQEQVVKDLQTYNSQLSDGKIKFLKELNIADPNSRDVFHRDLAESRFIGSLKILQDKVDKTELTKNDQWFLEKKGEIDAGLEALKEAGKTGTKGTGTKGRPKSMNDVETLTDEVSVITPVDPNAPKTELSLNTMQRGYQIKNSEIGNAMESLIGKLQQNGIDMTKYISGWDQVQVGDKAGAAKNVPRFKDGKAKQDFYNLVSALDFAYTKEAEDSHIDNQSFSKWIKDNFTDYHDDDPNSKFNFSDKIVNDALNSMKGTSALLPKMDKLFADDSVVKTLAQIDGAIRNKKNVANAYREALNKSGSLSDAEVQKLKTLSDDDLMNGQMVINMADIKAKAKTGEDANYGVIQEKDGTYSIGEIFLPVIHGKAMDKRQGEKWYQKPGFGADNIPDPRFGDRFMGGFKTKQDAQNALGEQQLSGVVNGQPITLNSPDLTIRKDNATLNRNNFLSENSLKKADAYIKQTYSYVQQNLNTTVTNMKQDKPAYEAVQDALSIFITRARAQVSPDDMQIDGVTDPRGINGVKNMEVLGATMSNTEDIFNPNPMYEIRFVGNDKDGKEKTYTGRVSLRSFLATNPNYKTADYAEYFAPFVYAEQDAYEMIKSNVNPLEGSQSSYANRDNIDPVYNRINSHTGKAEFVPDSPMGKTVTGESLFGNDYQWETIPVEKDGKTTMISYQVVSLGQNTNLGNIKTKDGQQYKPGAFYIKMKVPTSTGEPKVIFLKRQNGESITFNSAAYAHYTLRDLILNNPEIKMDEVDASTNEPNYLTTNPSTLRGILNSQLSYNGYSKLETVKIKDALGKEVEKQQAKELQVAK